MYADKGTYNETVSLVGGVNMFGGYDSTKMWARSLSNESLIQGTTDTGVIANDVAAATTLQLFTISALPGGVGTRESSYGARVIQLAGPRAHPGVHRGAWERRRERRPSRSPRSWGLAAAAARAGRAVRPCAGCPAAAAGPP